MFGSSRDMPSAGKTCAVCSHTAENPRLYRGHWYCVQTSRKGLTCYQLAKLKQQKQVPSSSSRDLSNSSVPIHTLLLTHIC
mmetsp:Transcript_19304/g.38203  ORF Transcript_19304/g.38203 Transcript_19304/m.38203 type:complete len:81 (+) Transcript_19304:27-269(+)